MGYASQGANALVVVNRWTFRLYPVTGEIDTLAFNNEEGCVELEKHRGYVAIGEDGSTGEPGNADQKRRAVEKFISGLPSDIPVVLVMPIPEFGCDIAKMNFQQYRRTGEVPSELSSSRAVYEKRNAFFTRVVGDALVRNVPNATRRVDPSDLFCDTREEGRCMAQVDGVPLYLDDDHLSDAGAALVVEAIFDTLGIE
jgi:hypothetical protein